MFVLTISITRVLPELTQPSSASIFILIDTRYKHTVYFTRGIDQYSITKTGTRIKGSTCIYLQLKMHVDMCGLGGYISCVCFYHKKSILPACISIETMTQYQYEICSHDTSNLGILYRITSIIEIFPLSRLHGMFAPYPRCPGP